MNRFKIFNSFLLYVLLLGSNVYSQESTAKNEIIGVVIEATTNLPLEYASVFAQNKINSNIISGSMTDDKGRYSFEVPNGSYFVKIEYLGFNTITIDDVVVNGITDIGVSKIQEDREVLDEVVVVARRSTVDIKLDKKVYNVGDDMIVKGGTAGDVLDNVPSITVDSDGKVSLRGNENVKVLIDGKPSGLANNVQEAMSILSAESIDRVEVITNPSARYEAEGGGGIINIILKKGEAPGFHGNVNGTIGDPRNYRINTNFNLRGEKYNFFTTLGYRDRETKRIVQDIRNEYFDPITSTTDRFIDEKRLYNRNRKGYDIQLGLELYLTPSITWTNTFVTRKSDGTNPNSADYNYFDQHHTLMSTKNRYQLIDTDRTDMEYATSIEKKFSDPDHIVTLEATLFDDVNNGNSIITERSTATSIDSFDNTYSKEKNKSALFRLDYILPLGESSKLEAGYLGSFKVNNNNFILNNKINDVWVQNNLVTNHLEYKENINALYGQYGGGITDKLSYLAGLRWENSNINVNELLNNDYNKKKYNDLFPSLFLNYEFDESTSFSLSYSKRIQRPTGALLTPFSNYASNINYFRGNPDLNPSKTNAFDFGFIKRWTGFTINGTAYYNKSTNTFQIVKRIVGTTVDDTPITVSSPINLSSESRYGFEFTLNYIPYKWWRLNTNFNFFRSEMEGSYAFLNNDGNDDIQTFDKSTNSWFTRVSSKISLPYEIDWQMNALYNGPVNTAQGREKGNLSSNTALSKDMIKGKGTVALSITDVFNSKKRDILTNLPQSISHSVMQNTGRQVNLTFTYRFNQPKKTTNKVGELTEEVELLN